MQRILIVGGAGSGKTTLARKLGTYLNVPFYDSDEIGYEGGVGAPRPRNVQLADLERITTQPAWVVDGAMLWTNIVLQRADTIVWLDLPWRIRRWRIITRHIKADLARNNRHSGYLKLYRFYISSRNYERDETISTPQPPNGDIYENRATVVHYLEQYKSKVIHCRTTADVARFERTVTPG